MLKTIIKSSRILTPLGSRPGYLIINDGIIEDVVEQLNETKEVTLTDVGDAVVMPGVIDPHVHINEPGRTEWEGFDTATRAAITGGITTLTDMPLNAQPVTTTSHAFHIKASATKNKLHTNVAFWGGVVPGNEDELEGLIECGVFGFKAFLTHSGIDDFANVTEADLIKMMPIIARHGLPLLVHCELTDSINRVNNNNRSYANYLASRPAFWEDEAVTLMIRLCEQFNCRVHIVHVSSANAITIIKEAKQKGLPVTAETAQHYLYFTAEEILDGQTQFKCAPPIRDKANNDLLWQALQDGILDFVATDHSPATPDLKETTSGDFLKAWGGIASLQFALPVLWTAAKKRNIPVEYMAKWLCENPAKLIGLEHKKGRLEKGYDADLVIWQPEKTFTVSGEMILHKHKITPYLGEHLNGVVLQTYLNGNCVYNINGPVQLNCGSIITRQS